MGLLDGLSALEGPPPPPPSSNPSSSVGGPDALSQFSSGARGWFGDLSQTLAPAMENVSETAKSGVTSIRRMMGDEEDLEAAAQMSISEEMSSMFNLTMFQRILLFCMCFGTGVVLICMSFTFLPLIMLAPHKFTASFTLGNVLAIVSTWILVGPKAQLQSMFHPERAIASGIYVGSLLFALVAAFWGGTFRYVLVLVAMVAEIGACKLKWDFVNLICVSLSTNRL